MRDSRSYLWNVLHSAKAIAGFVSGVDVETYETSEIVHSAVERKFEIIGEALNLLAKADPDLAAKISGFKQMIAFRNLLIHGYASVDHGRVWSIIMDDLPKLLDTVEKLLEELDRG
jgi:uncharacterized protein with HEPN domain